MLVLSLLFVTVVVVFVFSLTRDTGKHTKHARRAIGSPSRFTEEASHSVGPSEIIKVN